MLRTRQLIPPLTARTFEGQIVCAWNYKQKRNLVLAFLHCGCARCEEFLGRLVGRAADFAEQEAVALVIFSELPTASLRESLPAEIVVAADVSGRSQRAFLGEDVFSAAGQERLGVFVADRYGELHAQWVVPREGDLPGVEEILGGLRQLEIACEECGAPHWPADT